MYIVYNVIRPLSGDAYTSKQRIKFSIIIKRIRRRFARSTFTYDWRLVVFLAIVTISKSFPVKEKTLFFPLHNEYTSEEFMSIILFLKCSRRFRQLIFFDRFASPRGTKPPSVLCIREVFPSLPGRDARRRHNNNNFVGHQKRKKRNENNWQRYGY